jgi:hypothetical protein
VNALISIHVAVTWALVGLIWTVQTVQYPLFAKVGAEAFPVYHRRHCAQITWVVAPLMLTELLTAVWLVWAGFRNPWFLVSLGFLAWNWISTAWIQVPLHNQLAVHFDPAAHKKLVQTNWGRTAAWSLRGVLVLIAQWH